LDLNSMWINYFFFTALHLVPVLTLSEKLTYRLYFVLKLLKNYRHYSRSMPSFWIKRRRKLHRIKTRQ
jgi:hypothetical protein